MVWKKVLNFEDYEISTTGLVKSFKHSREGRILTPKKSKGYLNITLCNFYKHQTFRIHRLVAMTYIPGDFSLQINHINGNKHDNRVENLEWVSSKENVHHAIEIGLIDNKGENSSNTELLDSEVSLIIQDLLNTKLSFSNLAKKYQTTKSIIHHINGCECWKHLHFFRKNIRKQDKGKSLTKLTKQDTLEIIDLLRKGVSMLEIGVKFKVTETAISRINRGISNKYKYPGPFPIRELDLSNANRKLSIETILNIVQDLKTTKLSGPKISIKYKVSNSLVSLVNLGKVWKQLHQEETPIRKKKK